MDLSGYQALVWSLTGVLLAAFAGFAMVYAFVRRRRLAGAIKFNQEEFITARRQVGPTQRGIGGALGGRSRSQAGDPVVGTPGAGPAPARATHNP